jgi:hypothetical protein
MADTAVKAERARGVYDIDKLGIPNAQTIFVGVGVKARTGWVEAGDSRELSP